MSVATSILAVPIGVHGVGKNITFYRGAPAHIKYFYHTNKKQIQNRFITTFTIYTEYKHVVFHKVTASTNT